MVSRIRVAVAAAAALLAAGCSSSPPPSGSAGGQKGAGSSVPVHYSAPAASSLRDAELDVAAGATRLAVRAAAPASNGNLFEAAVSGQGSPTLRVDTAGNRVRISTGSPGTGDTSLGVTLDPQVSWRIRLSGGASSLALDLSRLRLAGLEIAGGASTMDVALPGPRGAVQVKVSGGATTVRVTVPPSAPVQVLITGGIAHASVDGQSVDSPSRGRRIDSPGYGTAVDRYEIRLAAGASSFVLKRG